jgi:DNA polymerase-3 subunit alpha
LSYAIGITDIDPLEYDLIFERFLNPGRISMPDIDTDFEDTERDRVIQYIRRTYGVENVAHIGTYMTMAAKAAFKDVARVYGFKFEQSNKLAGMIEEKTIQKSIDKNKDLQEAIQNDSRLEKVLEIAMELEGTVRQT